MVSFVIEQQTWIKDYDSNSHVEEENPESDEDVASGSPIESDEEEEMTDDSLPHEMTDGSLSHEMTDGFPTHEMNVNVGLQYTPVFPQFSPSSTCGELGSPKKEEDFC